MKKRTRDDDEEEDVEEVEAPTVNVTGVTTVEIDAIDDAAIQKNMGQVKAILVGYHYIFYYKFMYFVPNPVKFSHSALKKSYLRTSKVITILSNFFFF